MTPALAAAIVLAGAAGALLRFAVARAFARRPGRGLPWAVLLVNVVGSAIGGVVLGFAVRGDLAADIQLILLTGLCGGLTTFSTLSVETVQFFVEGKARVAVLSMATNLTLGIGAAAVAFAAVTAL